MFGPFPSWCLSLKSTEAVPSFLDHNALHVGEFASPVSAPSEQGGR